MKCIATFPVYLSSNRRFENNLKEYGTPVEYLICKDINNRDLLAISPEKCSKTQNYTICEDGIDTNKCIACLACQIKIAGPDNGVDALGIPSEDVQYTYDELSKMFFKGKYVIYPSNKPKFFPILRRFNEYTGNRDERNFTNPLIAAYLWSISKGNAFVSCSPSHELSIDVPILNGEREGHLDVTLRTIYENKKYLFVVEGKRNVKSFLTDSSREQNRKYERRIREIGEKLGYVSLFSYIIGGCEEPMYPPMTPDMPKNVKYQKKFFMDILKNKKRFISMHALRGLGILYISSKGDLGLENVLYKIFEDVNVYGLVLGGVVAYRQNKFVLESLHEYI